ncbi:MAG: SurA N-terminal domain-containing protein [Nanoarchaeota archaeon]
MEKTNCKTTATTSAIICIILLIFTLAALIGGCARGKAESGPEGKAREIAAMVNGVRVYFDEVNEEYATLTPLQQANLTKADALSFVVEREILYQEAVRQDLNASGNEVALEYYNFLASHNLTESDLEEQLSARNSGLERFKLTLKKQLLINKLLDKKIPRQFIIPREEVEAFYSTGSFSSRGLSFNQSENAIVELLTALKSEEARQKYISLVKDRADIVIVAVPS